VKLIIFLEERAALNVTHRKIRPVNEVVEEVVTEEEDQVEGSKRKILEIGTVPNATA